MIELTYRVKPLQGEACNGCGYCCQQEVCQLFVEVHGTKPDAPCPSLVYKDGRTYCGLVLWASPEIGALFMRLLGIGRGCCADD